MVTPSVQACPDMLKTCPDMSEEGVTEPEIAKVLEIVLEVLLALLAKNKKNFPL